MARDFETIVRNHGWKPSSGNESLTDILSSAIAAGQLFKINNNPQRGALSKASKIVLTNPYYKAEKYTSSTRYYRYPYQEDWSKLDFLDLDESLRMKLTDGDIAGVLACIDAINHLKILRLPHCIKIRGDGLFPLRGSVVLQNVDLSIVPIEIDQTPMLSIDAVLPTLESIVEMNQNVLKNVHVPKVWRDSYNEKLNNFYFERSLLPNVHLGSGTEHLSLNEKRERYLIRHPNPYRYMDRFKMDCHECSNRFGSTYGGPLNVTCESVGSWIR